MVPMLVRDHRRSDALGIYTHGSESTIELCRAEPDIDEKSGLARLDKKCVAPAPAPHG
jgi:hypothetical protein